MALIWIIEICFYRDTHYSICFIADWDLGVVIKANCDAGKMRLSGHSLFGQKKDETT